MSEGIIIALITAIGSLVGGIIGEMIAANAAIKAAAIKEKVDQASSQIMTEGSTRKTGRFWGFLGGAFVGACVILFLLKLTGYIPPISFGNKFITKLIIPSNNNLGFTYTIPKDGVYTFQYSDSAVSGWPSDNESEERWHTTVICFRGDRVIWDGGGVSFDFALFQVGSEKSYKTRDEAIKASIGKKATAGFKASDQITCIIADGRYDFDDNNGEVILDVFLSP